MSRNRPLKYWVSSKKFTGQVDSVDGLIVDAPPVWRKFKGQPLNNLLAWLRRIDGALILERIDADYTWKRIARLPVDIGVLQ